MTTVYETHGGLIREHELVKQTPKGFRVKCGYGSGTTMVQAKDWIGWKSLVIREERFEIATLDEGEAKAHAKLQRECIRQRVINYTECALSRIEGLD